MVQPFCTYSKPSACLGDVSVQPGRDCTVWSFLQTKGTQIAWVAIKGRQHCCKLFKGRVLSVHKTSSCLLPHIRTELFKHMLHPHRVISVSQQSVAEQLVKTYCSVNCIGMQMPSHLWINIYRGKRMYKETQGLWHSALRLPRAMLQPTSSGHPFPASVGYRGFAIVKKESSGKISGCVKDTRVLKASSSPSWPTDCHQGTWKIRNGLEDLCISLLHAKMKKISLLKKKVNGKETAQPQWDFERYPSICIGCESVTLHQSYAAQEEVNAGNETRFYLTCSYRVYWYTTQNIMEGNYLCQQ